MRERLARWILVADLVWAVLAVGFAYAFRTGWHSPGVLWSYIAPNYPAIAALAVVWTVLSSRRQLHGFKGGWNLPAIVSQSAVGVGILMTVLLALAFLTRQMYSRLQALYLTLLLFGGFVAVRCGARFLVGSKVRAGAVRRVAILGNGRLARELAAKISRHPETMWELVGFIYPANSDWIGQSPSLPAGTVCMATLNALEFLREQRIDELLVANQISGSEFQKLIVECRRSGIRISVVPQWYELYVSKTRLIELDGLPVLSLESCTPSPLGLLAKRAFDLVVGSMLLALAAPFLVVVGTLLYLRKGRALRAETRCGKDSSPFPMYRLNVDRDSPTLSGLEKILNQLSLTELPQLFNVLRGEMSLVGPRPEGTERVKHYSEWQRQRLSVRPGLTGLAQVYGIREQHSSEEKARFDLQYLYDWSIFSDLSLLLQSVWTLAFRPWAARRPVHADVLELAGAGAPFEAMNADRSQPCTD